MIKLINILGEVGEASAKPFKISKQGSLNSLFNDLKKISNDEPSSIKIFNYEAQSDKARYEIKFGCSIQNILHIPSFNKSVKKSKPQNYNLIIYVAFNVAGADNDELSGLNEQYRLMATVVQCVYDFVKNVDKEIRIDKIIVQPKADTDTSSNINSKRGRIYLSYIKKNISKLPGKWTVYGNDKQISILSGDWTGGNIIAKS